MRAPPKYSVSPLPSICTVPPRPVTFAETLKAIIAWLRGTKPGRSEVQPQDRLVARPAEEMEQAETNLTVADETNRKHDRRDKFHRPKGLTMVQDGRSPSRRSRSPTSARASPLARTRASFCGATGPALTPAITTPGSPASLPAIATLTACGGCASPIGAENAP
jgi:hypothetical protein